MLYITPMMIEPTTASIAFYLLAKTPMDITKHRRVLLRRPHHVKKRVCKWILYNKHELIDSVIDEANDTVLDSINIISHFNPSIFVVLYIIALILVIIF